MYPRAHVEGLGKWYQKLLDVVGEAGASLVDQYGGKEAGNALRAVHKGWTTVAFAPKGGRPPQAPPGAAPQYDAAVPYSQAPQAYAPSYGPAPAGWPGAALPTPPDATKRWLLIGGIGLGAVILIWFLRNRDEPREGRYHDR